MLSDEELKKCIFGVMGRHEKAYETFIKNYAAFFAKVASRFSHSPAEQEEWADLLLLHALDQILRGKLTFRSAASFNSWLFSVASRKAVELCRRKNRVQEIAVEKEKLEHLPDPSATAIEAKLENREIMSLILAAVNELKKPDFKSTLIMIFKHGLTLEEIALKRGKPVNTIRTWERRGKMALKEVLIKQHPDLFGKYKDKKT